MSEILVVAEPRRGREHPSTLEACYAAARMGTATGWRWAKLVPSPASEFRDAASLAAAVAAVAREAQVVLMGATATGKDVMARVAGHLQVPLAQDCVGFRVAEEKILFTRSLYGGKVLAEFRLAAQPVLATFRPRTQLALAAETDTATIEIAPLLQAASRVQIERQAAGAGRPLDVTEADIVVSGGRGMQGPQHWHILEELARTLGSRATLACSRPVSDDGWRPRAEHVGQTGRAIAPDVYIACGISGAIQHVAGIAGSKCIVAINRDPDAPIFKVADYGIVGDLFEVVPALTRAIQALQAI